MRTGGLDQAWAERVSADLLDLSTYSVWTRGGEGGD